MAGRAPTTYGGEVDAHPSERREAPHALDLADDTELAEAHALFAASRAVDRPHSMLPLVADLVAEWRHVDPGEDFVLRGLCAGGRLVGLCQAWFPLGDNTSMVWASVDVLPEARRTGHGAALVEDLVAVARSRGRTLVVVEAAYPPDRADDHPYRRFAQAHGFRVGLMEVARRLVLPVSSERLDALEQRARRRHAGRYAVSVYERVPEELLAPLCRLKNLVAEQAPAGDIPFEAESLTPERYGDLRDADQAAGRVRLTALATEIDTGLAVAFTELMLRPGVTRAEQWGTLVDEAHRGHRLGLAVKVATLRALQSDHPDRLDVMTTNAVENPWMVAVNDDLGFRPVELAVSFSRTV